MSGGRRRGAPRRACRWNAVCSTPLLRPLSGGSYEGDYEWFRLVSLIACVAGLLGIARPGRARASPWGCSCRVAHSFQPLKSDIRVGNVNEVQAGRDRGPCGCRRALDSRCSGGGRATGVLVVFKPNLVPSAAGADACWPARPPPEAGAAGGARGRGAGLALLCSVLAFGSLAPDVVRLRHRAAGGDDPFLQSTWASRAVARGLASTGRGSRPAASSWPPLACSAGGAVSGPRCATPRPRSKTPPRWLAGSLVYLLSAPMVWQHYLLLALPGGSFCCGTAAGRRARLAARGGGAAPAAYRSWPITVFWRSALRDLQHQESSRWRWCRCSPLPARSEVGVRRASESPA